MRHIDIRAVLILGVCSLVFTVPVLPQSQTIRMLVSGDPYAAALLAYADELEADYRLEIDVFGYRETYDLLFLNQRDDISSYDIVAFDVLWLLELTQRGVLRPVDDQLLQGLNQQDFLLPAIEATSYEGNLYGLPIQPHPELLWYHADLFEAENIPPPETTDDLLAAAAHFTRPADNLYGICWNAQRQQALGQQMTHFYAAFGGRVLATDGTPTIDTAEGRAAAEFALALLPYSPPDILNMAWDQRIRRFARGDCAMTYGWAARVSLLTDLQDAQATDVTFLPPPHAPGQEPVTPIGTWSLGIPSNIAQGQLPLAQEALAELSQAATQKRLAELGNAGMPRLSLLADSDLQARYPTFPVVSELQRQQRLQLDIRPANASWAKIESILGTTFHNMLIGNLTAEEATATTQSQLNVLLEG